MILIYDSENYIVEYDEKTCRYRVSIFENYHWQDEFWFDAYKPCEVI